MIIQRLQELFSQGAFSIEIAREGEGQKSQKIGSTSSSAAEGLSSSCIRIEAIEHLNALDSKISDSVPWSIKTASLTDCSLSMRPGTKWKPRRLYCDRVASRSSLKSMESETSCASYDPKRDKEKVQNSQQRILSSNLVINYI